MKYGVMVAAVVAGVALAAMQANGQSAQQGEQSAIASESTAGEGGGLQEIVVTAQRRAERVQDVPITVSAVSAAMLADTNLISAQQIGQLVSGVLMASGNTAVMPFIRGIGSAARTAPAEASVATYIDGDYLQRLYPPILYLNGDIESIEVLKGPQGTLFGRNSSGGAINIITKTPQPGSALEGTTEASYGNYNTFTSDGYAASGLGERSAVDLAYAVYEQADGWGYDIATNQTVRKANTATFRSKFVFEPASQTRIIITGDYVNFNSDAGQQGPYYNRLMGYPPGSPQAAAGIPLPVLGSIWDTNMSGTDPFTHVKDSGISARIEQDLPIFKITETASYRYATNEVFSNASFSPVAWVFITYNPETVKSFTDELLLQSHSGSPIQWTGGLYYGTFWAGFSPGETFGPALDNNAAIFFSGQFTRTIAAFGQLTLPLGWDTNLTLGGRVTHDQIHAYGNQQLALGGYPSAEPLIQIPGTLESGDDSYTRASWRVSLDHHLTKDIMVYALASAGFKSGTFAIAPLTDTTPVKPEVSKSYEAGIKTELFDHRLRLNVDGYYTKITDLQEPVTIGTTDLLTVRNIPGMRSYGAEVEATASIMQGLEFRGGYSYINARYTSYPNCPYYFYSPNPPFGNPASVTLSCSGNVAERAPENTFNVGGNYELPIQDNKLSLNVNYAYTSKFFWNPDNLTVQPSYGLLAAELKYSLKDARIFYSIWGNNLLGAQYYTEGQETATQIGTIGVPAPPRTYGAKVGFKF